MSDPIDLDFMAQALQLAEQASVLGEVPVGAVLVADGVVVARAYNESIRLHDPCAHAEIQALRQAGAVLKNYRLLNTTLYSTLEPCAMCAGALVHARVGRLVYGAADPRSGAAGSVFQICQSSHLNHRVAITAGVLAGQARMLLQAFFKVRRNHQ